MQAHERGIDLRKTSVVQAELGGHIAAQVVDYGVRVLHQRVEPLPVLRQVERDALLPQVEALEVLAVVRAEKARPGVPADVAAGRRLLDLDDLGAEAGKEHRAVGAGAHVLHRENADSLERLHSFFSR